MPVRIQRKRTRGWKMPAGAVYVGRPTKWGNSFNITKLQTREMAIERFKFYASRPEFMDLSELRGKDLACWCPLDQPCHADVLLELANK